MVAGRPMVAYGCHFPDTGRERLRIDRTDRLLCDANHSWREARVPWCACARIVGMRLELSADSFDELLAEESVGGIPVGRSRAWPDVVGHGSFDAVEVRPGIVLYLIDLAPHTDVRITATEGAGYLELSYHLQGAAEGTITGVGDLICTTAGQRLGLLAPRGHGGCVTFSPRHPVLTVAVVISPTALAELVPTPDTARVAAWLEGAFRLTPVIERPAPLDSISMSTARQLVDCPFTGTARRLFLEAKVLELIAYEAAAGAGEDGRGLPAADEVRIREAAAILCQHLEMPPTLQNLARRVGINELKLKRGFHAVFGTTVFGYLRHHRLHAARELLLRRQVSVGEAAWRVGYACPSRFASAFRRQFGASPSAVRRGH